ncbi:MAG: glycosyltransferase [Actinomycetia bacterium]|nr:glycosyltransferase [Actinomycetes bacterium]
MLVTVTPSHDADRPLRIVLAIGSLAVGGTETQLVKLAAGLMARGHEVHVIALRCAGPLQAELQLMGIPTRIFAYGGLRLRNGSGKRSLRVLSREAGQLLAVWRHLKNLRPDVCHAFLFTCYTHVLPLASAAGVPVRVNGRRGAPPPTPTGLLRKVLDLAGHRSSSLYISNSQAIARELTRMEKVRPCRVKVIANCVELPARTADVVRQPPCGIVVANLIGYKGHADLVEALALLEAPPRMCIVGDGPERERLATLIEARRLGHVVELTGAVPDARELLAVHQFAVLPSHAEGLPNAVLEAMAAGLPVIATSVGGVPEVVIDGVTGILVPPKAPAELAAAITRIVASPPLRVKLGSAARQTAERFSVSACAARHEAAYRAQPR